MQLSKLKKELSFNDLYLRFINDSKRGKRLQPNGKRISPGTVKNYEYTFQLLQRFCLDKKFVLRVISALRLSQRELQTEKNYWKKFYKRFTDYMYEDCGFYDNYSGQNIKNLKTFFNYLNKELIPGTGDFHCQIYVRKDEIPIFPMMPEELSLHNEPSDWQLINERFVPFKDIKITKRQYYKV